MIAKLYGQVDTLSEDRMLLNVQGICYEIFCSKKVLASLALQQEISLWIEHIFRTETQVLCGFLSQDEQNCFKEMIQVKGVGPKAALALLSLHTPQSFWAAIFQQKKEALTLAGGIGVKTAERLLMEMKNSPTAKKVMNDSNYGSLSGEGYDAIEALVSLGYEKNKARKVVGDILQKEGAQQTESLVKKALGLLITR
jgi:Holliday junction DNA helicase RuvA